MKNRDFLLIILIIAGLVLAAGCSQPGSTGQPVLTTAVPPAQQTSAKLITPADLTVRVKEAVAYAHENGREKAVATFNDPDGPFVRDHIYVFAEDYDGLALAEPFEQNLVGTNIRDMTDRYGVPLIRNLEETGRYGIGMLATITRTRKTTKPSNPSSRLLSMSMEHIMSVPGDMQDRL